MAHTSLFARFLGAPQRRFRESSRWSAIEALETRQLLAADLAFSEADLVLVSPISAAQISIITHFTVEDIGNQALIAANVLVTTVLSANATYGDSDDAPAGNTTLDMNLSPGGDIAGQIFGNPSFHSYLTANFLLVKVDASNTVAEGNENNNVIAISLPRVPLLTASPGQLTGKLHQVHRVDPGITFSDTDTPNFSGGNLTVQIKDDVPGDNVLSIKQYHSDAGVVRRKKDEILIGKRIVGLVRGGTDGDSLIITFNGAVTAADVRKIAAAVSIKGRKGTPGIREVDFFVFEPTVVTSTPALKLVNLT